MTRVGSLTKEAWISKKKDISLISFQQLDFEIDIFEIWDLIPEQERLSNKKSTNQVCKILDRSDINTSRHFLKSRAVEGNTVDPEKKKQAVFRSAGDNKKND
jgi:hypothetical protein